MLVWARWDARASVNKESEHMNGLGATKRFGYTFLVLSTIGLVFSTLIMHDKLQMALDPNFEPACTFNEVISCTDVMASDQAATFGFANPFIGMIGFAVMMTLAVMLIVGAKLPRWMWYCTLVGLGLGVVFVHWLAYSAIYSIGALCPYCMAVWAATLPMFVMTLVHIQREKRREAGEDVPHSVLGMPLVVVIAWFLAFTALILDQFAF